MIARARPEDPQPDTTARKAAAEKRPTKKPAAKKAPSKKKASRSKKTVDKPPTKTVTKKRPRSPSPSLGELAERFLAHLAEIGRTESTLFSYRQDLSIAAQELGEKTRIATITAKAIAAFNDSDAVTTTRGGRAKARPTVDKTRRVLRLALEWAVTQKMIAKAPIPTAKS